MADGISYVGVGTDVNASKNVVTTNSGIKAGIIAGRDDGFEGGIDIGLRYQTAVPTSGGPGFKGKIVTLGPTFNYNRIGEGFSMAGRAGVKISATPNNESKSFLNGQGYEAELAAKYRTLMATSDCRYKADTYTAFGGFVALDQYKNNPNLSTVKLGAQYELTKGMSAIALKAGLEQSLGGQKPAPFVGVSGHICFNSGN